MTGAARARWDDDVGLDRTYVVVPAVMGVGLLFSVATVLRDAVRGLTSGAGRGRRAALAGHATARAVLSPASDADVGGLRPRSAVATGAAGALGLSVLLLVGGTYARLGTGALTVPTWLWALALALGTASGAVGLAGARAAVRWPDLPAASLPVLRVAAPARATRAAPARATRAAPARATRAAPAGTSGDAADPLAGRRRVLRRWLVPIALAATANTLYVGLADTRRVDDLLLRALEPVGDLTALAALDPLGATEIAVGMGTLVGIATWRCRPFAVTYVVTALAGWGLYEAIGAVVVRVRPDSPTMRTDSYPSGHVLQGTVLAGLVSLALAVLLRRRWLDPAVAVLLGTGVVAMALARVRATDHWPLDVLGSMLLGTALVLAVHLVLAHPGLHERCRDCPWRS